MIDGILRRYKRVRPPPENRTQEEGISEDRRLSGIPREFRLRSKEKERICQIQK